jgi:hypothetical protein
MSKIEVDQITQQSGTTVTVGGGACKTAVVDATTVTLGRSGGTVSLASGATQSGFGRTGTVDWQTGDIKTGNFTAVNGQGFFVNTTSGAITATLPAGSAGAIVSFADYAATWNSNALTVSPNGSDKIGGENQVAVANTEGQSITFVYVDSTQGWINTMDSTSNVRGKPPFIVATGGTITTVCTNFKVHTFTGPGTFDVTNIGVPSVPADQKKVDYMIVAGGGGSGYHYGSGGGGGGFRESKTSAVSGCWTASPLVSSCTITVSEQAYPIVVGAGGSGAPGGGPFVGGKGSDSSGLGKTSTGGGFGIGASPGSASGGPGGSGGGAGGTGPGGSGGSGNTPPVSPPQGQNGGGPSGPNSGSGGGGAGGAGPSGKPGGAGVTSSINGSPVARSGGGSAGPGPTPAPSGGSAYGAAGAANTGAGAGGDAQAAGGSGIVVIRYKFQ